MLNEVLKSCQKWYDDVKADDVKQQELEELEAVPSTIL